MTTETEDHPRAPEKPRNRPWLVETRTAWLGRQDSNSEMSPQNIPLKDRADFPGL
jgi:hypothetical protein